MPGPLGKVSDKARFVANVAALASITGKRDGDQAQTGGYTTLGDGGSNTYYWDAGNSDTADGGFVITATGGRWKAVDQSVVNAKQWGCLGDNSTDDTVRAQAAIDAAVANNITAHFPAGRYVISDTLWLTGSDSETSAATFWRSTVTGVGSGYAANASLARTCFVASAKDRPALAIQHGRAVIVEGLQVIGPNDAPTSLDETDSDRADWLTADVDHTQYAPQAGICIDPCLASDPGSGYAHLTYLGSSEGSNGVVIRDVELRGHGVGLCVRPDGGLANNDQLHLNNVQFIRCATGVGIGNSQTRSASAWTHMMFTQCHTCIDTRTFGDGQGVIPTLTGCQIGTSWRAFNANVAFDATAITGLYTESLNWLGILGEGTSATRSPISFFGCHINRSQNIDETNACPLFMAASRPVAFYGCEITQNHQDADLLVIGGTHPPLFDSCTFKTGSASVGMRILGLDFHGYVRPTLRKCVTRVESTCLPISVDAMDSGNSRSLANGSKTRWWLCRSTGVYQTGDSASMESVQYADASWRERDTTAGSIDVTDGVLTFTTTDQPFWAVGDYIYGYAADPEGEIPGSSIVPVFKVTNVDSTVTARAIGDPAWLTAFTNIQTARPEWAPIVDFEGDTTSSSATISNTTHDGVVRAGDWITGSGIPNNTRVTAVDDGANTITLSRNATATASGVKLYWGRLHSLDTTAVF